jgi:hypothetical protein
MVNDIIARLDRHVELLGHAFYTTGDVDCVADHRDLAFPRMPDATENYRAEMDSDADAEGHAEVVLKDRGESLPASCIPIAARTAFRRVDFSWLEGVCGREKMARCLAGEQPHTIWAPARADRQEFRRAE